MDNDKIAIIGTGIDGLASLMRLRLSELINDETIPSSIRVSDVETEPQTLEIFELKPVRILPMPFSRKEKSPYKCDGTFKRGRRR